MISSVAAGATANRGVSILLKRGFPGSLLESGSDTKGNLAWAIVEISGKKVLVLGIYGPSESTDNPDFFINTLFPVIDGKEYDHLIAGGDWNITLNPDKDNIGYTNPHNYKKVTRRLLKTEFESRNLEDIFRVQNEDKLQYSWTPFAVDSRRRARLDYFICDAGTSASSIGCSIEKVPLHCMDEDHAEITLEVDYAKVNRGKGWWKLNNSYLRDKLFIEMVRKEQTRIIFERQVLQENAGIFTHREVENMTPHQRQCVKLDENPHDIFESFLLRVRGESIKYGQKKASVRRCLVQKLKAELGEIAESLDAGTLSRPERLDKLELKSQVESRLKAEIDHESEGAHIRAKQAWALQGEKPTRLMLAREKWRGEQKFMGKLVIDREGVQEQVTNQDDVEAEIRSFYKKLYSPKDIVTGEEEILEFLGDSVSQVKTLSQSETDLADQEISTEEIEKVIDELKHDKSPGTSGFTNEFYMVFKNDLSTWIKQFLDYSEEKDMLSATQRTGSISLIPKGTKDKTRLGNWRPITLLNSLYKILSKCIANRIKAHLPHLIHEDQKGFVDGRYMGEAVRGICDTINNLKQNRKRALLTAIDFKKAFDSVDFRFMEGVLKILGFGHALIKRVKMLLYSFKAHTLHAGNISQGFGVGRGCRQGDPIASLLFVACIEILLIRIRWDNEICPVQISHRNPDLFGGEDRTMEKKVEAFADDCSLLTGLDMRTQERVVETLENFSKISGLEINAAKTQTMIIGSNVDRCQNIDTIFRKVNQVEILGVVISGDLEGMEINIDRKLEKMESIMKSWSYRTLTPFGRIVVIKSLVLPQITMLASLLPCMERSTIDKVDKMIQDFLWARHEKKKKIRVSKKRSWLREENGGMNVTDTGTFWTSIKIGWLRRALQGDSFIMETLNRDIQEVTHVRTSSIASLLAEKGTDHIAKVGKMLKNTFWQKALQHVTALAQGFYETNKVYVGEAIYWETKWEGRNVTPPNTSLLLKDRRTVMEVAMEDVGREGLTESEKDHILHARTLTSRNQAHDLAYPNHRGLTRALMWAKKGSNHWYKWLRAREEEDGLTRETEEKWNTALGRNVKISIPFWRSHYKRLKDIRWNGSIKLAEMMVGMRRQTVGRDLKVMGLSDTDTCRLCRSDHHQETECHIYSDCPKSIEFWEQLEGWARSVELHMSGSRITRCLGSANFPMMSPTNVLLTYGRKEIYSSLHDGRRPDYKVVLRTILQDKEALIYFSKIPGDRAKMTLMIEHIKDSLELW